MQPILCFTSTGATLYLESLCYLWYFVYKYSLPSTKILHLVVYSYTDSCFWHDFRLIRRFLVKVSTKSVLSLIRLVCTQVSTFNVGTWAKPQKTVAFQPRVWVRTVRIGHTGTSAIHRRGTSFYVRRRCHCPQRRSPAPRWLYWRTRRPGNFNICFVTFLRVWCRVKCGVRDAGKCRRVKCREKCGESPAIYTHEHTLNECSSTHCV